MKQLMAFLVGGLVGLVIIDTVMVINLTSRIREVGEIQALTIQTMKIMVERIVK